MITGSQGQVGKHLVEFFLQDGWDVIAYNHQQLDITSETQVHDAVYAHKPDLLINAAAYTSVDESEEIPELVFKINAGGPGYLARVSKEAGTRFFHLSTDYVFDGRQPTAYKETDKTNPLNVYGQSKLLGEKAVLTENPLALILRVSWVFSQYNRNFVKTMLRLTEKNQALKVVNDQHGGPTWAGHIALILVRLAAETKKKRVNGIYHFCGEPYCTWYEFADYFLRLKGYPKSLIMPVESSYFNFKAVRPANSTLSMDKLKLVLGDISCSWQDGIDVCFQK